MEKKPRLMWIALLLALASFASSACEKRPGASPNRSSSADQSHPSAEIQLTAGPVEPATVGREEESFASYIHFPKDRAASREDAAIQFYCDVSDDGNVETTYAVVGDHDEFKKAVQSALDWGRFKPAKVDGKPKAVYLAGTVLFMHQAGQPVIVVSLATADRERLRKLANYIQPQLLGGLRRPLTNAETNATIDLPNEGASEVLVKVSERGEIASSSVVSENPKDIGLGEFLNAAIKNARFTPAYIGGKPSAGEVNVVANFAEF